MKINVKKSSLILITILIILFFILYKTIPSKKYFLQIGFLLGLWFDEIELFIEKTFFK